MIGEETAAALVGLSGGILLGLAARLARFCTLGAVEDALYAHDGKRLRMWGVALGTAILATALLTATGRVDPLSTAYLATGWHPLAAIGGGLVFGYGMAIAGNCGYGALARMGGGDIRSFVIVMVFGLAAYATLSGPLAWIRVGLFPPEGGLGSDWSGPLSAAIGIPRWTLAAGIGVAILGAAISAPLRRDASSLFWSVVVGLAIAGGWWGTSHIAVHGFAGLVPVSHSFSAPVGETMLYAMTASAGGLSFGVGSVTGVVLGAALGCLIRGQFRWEACEDPRELRRQIGGAVLMGVGAVTAMGCSVGQGLSAFSVLAASAPLTLAAIFAGAALGLRRLIAGATAFD